METLEDRRLLTTLEAVPSFRSDDFSVTAPLTYSAEQNDGPNGFRESMSNGVFEIDAGRIQWSSPIIGDGTFHGVGTGNITNEFFSGANETPCSTFSIRDEGTMSFELNAQTSIGSVSDTKSTSLTFPSFESHLDEPPCQSPLFFSRVFDGTAAEYTAAFDVSNFTLGVSYSEQAFGSSIHAMLGPEIIE